MNPTPKDPHRRRKAEDWAKACAALGLATVAACLSGPVDLILTWDGVLVGTLLGALSDIHLRDRLASAYVLAIYKPLALAALTAACGALSASSAATSNRWPGLILLGVGKDKPLPVVLYRQEVEKLLWGVYSLTVRAVVVLTYGAGLRISEACTLRTMDVDSERMLLHVRMGKGRKDRE